MSEEKNKPLVYVPTDVDAKLNFESKKLDPPKTRYDVKEATYYERKSMEEALGRRSRKNDN